MPHRPPKTPPATPTATPPAMPPAPEPGRLSPGRRRPIPRFRDLWRSAPDYLPDPELMPAVDAALALGAPLLVTGEPGTGKTQIAYYLAWRFGVPRARVHRLDVRSTTTAEDLTARVDTVAYFHAAHDPLRHVRTPDAPPPDPRDHYIKGPLFKAWREAREPCVVLIDEIDKAPRDFPNDLLNTLDQHRFRIAQTDDEVTPPPGAPPPLVVITSNTERQLPPAFLRRCVYHHIRFDPGRVAHAVEAHARHLQLDGGLVDAAVARFLDLRQMADALNRAPSTGELLAWIVALDTAAADPEVVRTAALGRLPALSTLIKDIEDLDHLRAESA